MFIDYLKKLKTKKNIIKKFKKYFLEIVLITVSAVVTVYSVNQQNILNSELKKISYNTTAPHDILKPNTETPNLYVNTNNIKVDVSGAIENPGVYEATEGARLGDIIKKAGGVTYEADEHFIGRNFNMARILQDQDKIHIPYKFEIALKTFTEEETRILTYLDPKANYISNATISEASTKLPSEILISINSASIQELDTLPGIGETTASKIIDNRPYTVIDELYSNKVVNSSTWEKIKDLITL